jgi:hypothetical protein
MTANPPLRHQLRQGTISPSRRPARRTPATTLSARGWRLIYAYEDELRRVDRGRRVMARELRGLAVFMRWLIAYDVDLPEVAAEDLHAYRLSLRVSDEHAGAFDVVRRFYRFLYCRRLLRHDPGALVDGPAKGKRP